MALLAGMTEKQLLLTTVAGFAAVVILLGLGIGYGNMKHAGIVEETQGLQSQLQELTKIKDEISRLRKLKEDMGALMEEMRKILPSEDEVSEHELRATISAFASEAGVRWSGFRRAVRSAGGLAAMAAMQNPYVEESYVLDVEGGFHALASFINRLEEDCRRLLYVDTFSIEGVGGGLNPEKDDHGIALTLVAYKFKKPPAPP